MRYALLNPILEKLVKEDRVELACGQFFYFPSILTLLSACVVAKATTGLPKTI
jgi:hypothetical protein